MYWRTVFSNFILVNNAKIFECWGCFLCRIVNFEILIRWFPTFWVLNSMEHYQIFIFLSCLPLLYTMCLYEITRLTNTTLLYLRSAVRAGGCVPRDDHCDGHLGDGALEDGGQQRRGHYILHHRGLQLLGGLLAYHGYQWVGFSFRI